MAYTEICIPMPSARRPPLLYLSTRYLTGGTNEMKARSLCNAIA